MAGVLLFKSGFETPVAVSAPGNDGGNWAQILQNGDQGYNWQDIPARGAELNRFTYLVDIGKTLTNYAESTIETVTGWDGSPTKALKQTLKIDDPDVSGGTRNEYGFYPATSLTKIYIRYRAKLQPDLSTIMPLGTTRSIIISEAKEHGVPRADFRWNISIQRLPGFTPLLWKARAEFGDLDDSPVAWQVISGDYRVPEGEWATYEQFWSLSPTNGRIFFSVNGTTVIDYFGQTQFNDYVQVWWPWKLYIGSPSAFPLFNMPPNILYQWIDDVEIWSDFPPPNNIVLAF